MSDQNNSCSLAAQHAQNAKQLLGFLRGEHGGWLVQNQNTRAAVQRFQNLQPLLVAHRQLAHRHVKGHLQPGRCHQCLQTLAHNVIRPSQQHVRFCPQHHVFNRIQGVNQHEVLVHHANAVRNGVMRISNHHRLAIDGNLPALGDVKTVQHRHECAFASAVFTHNAVNCGGLHSQVNVVISQHRAKALANASHLHCGR